MEAQPELRGAAAARQSDKSAAPPLSDKSCSSASIDCISVQKSLKPLAESVVPHIGGLQTGLVKVAPYLDLAANHILQAYDNISEKVDPDWLLVAYGLVLCFFGGSYIALIAAIEAFGRSGWKVVRENGQICWEQAKSALAASAADDKVDDNNDGIADVKQMSKDKLVMRKIRVIMLSIDPARVSTAVGSLYMAFFAVLATLQIQFAKVITLGLSIGELIDPIAEKVFVPIIQSLSSPEYNRWVVVGVDLAIKAIACSLAWILQTIISAVQSASKGGQIVAHAALRLSNKHGYTNIDHRETLLDEMAGWSLAVIGFMCQFAFGFGVPFPLSLFLWPVDIVEYFLRWMVVNN